MKPNVIAGITPVFNFLLKAGVIIPCKTSPVCMPIFSVKEIRAPGKPEEWKFVQDLEAVNTVVDAVVQKEPNVSNPYTILTQITPKCKWFSVVDLANAFFSVPMHPDSQFWFEMLKC